MYLLLLLTIFITLFHFTEQMIGCKKVYVAPLLPHKNNGVDKDSLELFLEGCMQAKNRQFVTSFDFTYNASFTCFMNRDKKASYLDHKCQSQYTKYDGIYLNQSHYYGIKNFIFNQIEKDKECGKNALVIFIFDIKCEKIELYLDSNEIFGQGFEQTNRELQDKGIHFILLATSIEAYSQIYLCNNNLTDLKFSRSSNIQVNNVPLMINAEAGKEICSIESPIFYPEPTPDTTVLKESNDGLKAGISIASGILLFLLLLFFIFWARQIWARWKQSKIEAFADAHTRTARHIIFGKYKDEWEVTPKELKVDSGTVLGRGAFGVVYKGFLKKQRNKEWIEMDVAVKFTTEHSTETMRQDMIEEIGFMKTLGSHENLLVMVGYVKSIDNPVICTVFCSNGDLLGVLKKHELHFMSSNPCSAVEICLLLPDLLRLAIEVCNGLCYLASFNYIHRDIAARNVLLTDQLVAKLSDFGLCKKLKLYETTVVDKEGKFPVKYMPHESLKFGEFSEKTDVWAFGILLFEMFSGGKKPFDEVPMDEFVSHLENDEKPQMPDLTPQPLIQFLNEKVFQKYPSRRADFKEIKEELMKFHSIVCNVLLEEDRNSTSRKSSLIGSVRSSVRTN